MKTKLEKEAVDVVLKSLKDLRKGFDETCEKAKKDEILNSTLPFLVLALGNIVEIIDIYIKQYNEYRKRV